MCNFFLFPELQNRLFIVYSNRKVTKMWLDKNIRECCKCVWFKMRTQKREDCETPFVSRNEINAKRKQMNCTRIFIYVEYSSWIEYWFLLSFAIWPTNVRAIVAYRTHTKRKKKSPLKYNIKKQNKKTMK